jgi:hypothetical protein
MVGGQVPGGIARWRVSPADTRGLPRLVELRLLRRPGITRTRATTRRQSRRRGLPLALSVVGMATVGFNDIRLIGWTVSDLFFVAAAGLVVLYLLTDRTRELAPVDVRRTSPAVLLASLILLTGGTLSSLWAIDAFYSITVVLRFAWLTLVWFWVLRAVSPDRSSLGDLITGYKVTVLVSSVAAILGDLGVYQFTPNNWYGRQDAFFGHPNSLAGLLVAGLPFFLADVPRSERRPEGRPVAFRLAVASVVLLAVNLTGSITGLVSAFVAFGALGAGYLATMDTQRVRIKPLTVMAMLVGGAVGLALLLGSDAPAVERLTNYFQGEGWVASSADSRVEQREVVTENIDDMLVLGVGFDRESVTATGEVTDIGGIHNMYLKLIYEAGFVSFVGLLLLLVPTLQRIWRLLWHTRGTELYPIALALFASFVALNFNAQFQPILYRRYYWLSVAMIWALWALRRHEYRRDTSTSTDVNHPH